MKRTEEYEKLIQSFFTNLRPWYPVVSEVAALLHTTAEQFAQDCRYENSLAEGDDWRINPAGEIEVSHRAIIWQVIEAVGVAAIKDVLGHDQATAILSASYRTCPIRRQYIGYSPELRVETITGRVLKFVTPALPESRKGVRARSLTSERGELLKFHRYAGRSKSRSATLPRRSPAAY